MIVELQVLTYAALLQVVQFVLVSVTANRELGLARTTSARDPSRMGGKRLEEMVSDRTGRLYRALNNHFEGLILFGIAVMVLVLGDKTTGLTAICAWAYLVARILYVPAYWLGLRPWRSMIWAIGFAATVVMLLSTLI